MQSCRMYAQHQYVRGKFSPDRRISYRISGRKLENTGAYIRRRSLNGGEDEKIFENREEGITVSAVKNYGDKLYFTVTKWLKKDDIPENAEKMSWLSSIFTIL